MENILTRFHSGVSDSVGLWLPECRGRKKEPMKGSRGARGNPADAAALIRSVCARVSAPSKGASEDDPEKLEKNSRFPLSPRLLLFSETRGIFSAFHFLGDACKRSAASMLFR